MLLLLATVKEASEEFDKKKQHRSDCSRVLTRRGQVAAAQARLFKALKNQVWPGNKNVFLLRSQPDTLKRLSRPLGTDIKRMSFDNGGGDLSRGRPQAGSGCAGGPGGVRWGIMTGFRQNKGKMRTPGPSSADEKWDLAAV